MKIEINGANFINKGAQLMLAAVCRKLGQEIPDLALYLPQKEHSEKWRMHYNLQHSVHTPEYWKAFNFLIWDIAFNIKHFKNPPGLIRTHRLLNEGLGSLLSRTSLGKSLGLVRANQIDALIDISGYAFGDLWPIRHIKTIYAKTKVYHRNRKPIILLPQMFGPFENQAKARAFKKVTLLCNLIYARDQVSFDWLEKIGAPREKLRIAPDITIFYQPEVGEWQSPAGKPYGCLIPNARMIKKGKWGNKHVEMLVYAGKEMKKNGLTVYIVQHEQGRGDSELVQEISTRLGQDTAVFQHEDSECLKAFIGEAELLIGSRYHSIVAALSQGVPVIAMGWAHKYAELMKDFGVEKFIIPQEKSEEELRTHIKNLLTPQTSIEIKNRLRTAKTEMAAKNEEMWREVKAAITQ